MLFMHPINQETDMRKITKMNSNITTNNILRPTLPAATFAFWLNNLPTTITSKLFGNNCPSLLQAVKDFQLANPVDMQQILLEIPLLGTPYTDISFSYNVNTFFNNFFYSIPGQKIQPLFQYLNMLLPKENNVYIELDTSKNNEIPSVYIDCTNCEKIILSKLWKKDTEPPQWQKAQQIINNLPENWQLLYLGLMPGRSNFPLRIIFTTATANNQHLPCSVQGIDILLEAIKHQPLIPSIREKIKFLNDLEFSEITVSLNLFPNNKYDSLLGFEIFVPEENISPELSLTTPRGQKLLKTLTNWQTADDRIKLLHQCCGIFFPPQFNGCAESQVQVFLNHIKLQCDNQIILPTKAYITCNNYFR